MQKIWEGIKSLALIPAVFCTTLFWRVGDAFAEDGGAVGSNNIGTAAKGLAKQMDSVKNLGLSVSMVIGVVLIILGIIKLTKRSGGEDGPGKAIIFIVAGVLMLSIPAVLMMSSASIGFEESNQAKLNYSDIK